MSKCKFTFGPFYNDGHITKIVGRLDLFKDKNDFINACYRDYKQEIGDNEITAENIKIGQIRFCPTGYRESKEPTYYLINGHSKGASDVYYVEFNNIFEDKEVLAMLGDDINIFKGVLNISNNNLVTEKRLSVDKIKDLDDVKRVLDALDIKFTIQEGIECAAYEKIKDLCE